MKSQIFLWMFYTITYISNVLSYTEYKKQNCIVRKYHIIQKNVDSRRHDCDRVISCHCFAMTKKIFNFAVTLSLDDANRSQFEALFGDSCHVARVYHVGDILEGFSSGHYHCVSPLQSRIHATICVFTNTFSRLG